MNALVIGKIAKAFDKSYLKSFICMNILIKSITKETNTIYRIIYFKTHLVGSLFNINNFKIFCLK